MIEQTSKSFKLLTIIDGVAKFEGGYWMKEIEYNRVFLDCFAKYHFGLDVDKETKEITWYHLP